MAGRSGDTRWRRLGYCHWYYGGIGDGDYWNAARLTAVDAAGGATSNPSFDNILDSTGVPSPVDFRVAGGSGGFEDVVSGAQAAKTAGACCVGLTTSFSDQILKAAGADETIPNFRDYSL